jgi:hypothetical protein
MGALTERGHPAYDRPGLGTHPSVPVGLRRLWCSAVELSMLKHIHPKVVPRRDGASRTRIPPVLETGSLAAGSSLCTRKAARQVSLRAASGRNWLVPIQKPPASPEFSPVARTRACRHAVCLAGNRLTRDSRCSFQLACCLLSRVPVGHGRRNGLSGPRFLAVAQKPAADSCQRWRADAIRDWELDNAAARTPTRRSVISRLREVPMYEPEAGATSE